MPTPNTFDLPTAEITSDLSTHACCGGLRRVFMASWVVLTIGAIGAAAYFAGQASVDHPAISSIPNGIPLVNAMSAVSSDKYSMATGAVGDDSDGLFVLDHNSGLLQCSVLYPRIGKVGAQFTVNVADAIGAGGKGGGYLMVTGLADFQQSSNTPIASTVVYILNTATGNYACYGIPFNRTSVNSGRPQGGMLGLIFQGTANPIVNRDSLR